MGTALHKTVNGVDVDRFSETVDTIKENPNLANFQFKVSNRWLGATHNRTTVQNYEGVANDQRGAHEPFQLETDEPPVLQGGDEAPSPVENLLHALAGCVTTTLVFNAAAMGINIDEIESELEGDIDLQGFLGLDPNVTPGFKEIRMKLKIKSDADESQIRKLCEVAKKFSPVANTISRPVSVVVEGEKL